MAFHSVAPTGGLIIALSGLVPIGQGVDDAALARLLSLPRSSHQSEIRADYDAVRDRTRVWINTNEDDARLWSMPGQQMDVEMRLSAVVPGRGGSWPVEISIDFASLGSLPLVDREDAVELVADRRPVALTRRSSGAVRSGAMLFLTIETTIEPAELVRVATSTRVEGRVWGHRFALIESQFELLRAYLVRLAGR